MATTAAGHVENTHANSSSNAGASEREIVVFKAKLAEQAERYDEMADCMKELVVLVNEPLTVEERNLLSVAFKNAVGARRASLRIIHSLEVKHKRNEQKDYVKLTAEYQEKVAKELNQICRSIIDLLEGYLLKTSQSDVEAQVFYYKMKGDYFRYLCEFADESQKTELADKAKEAYNEASTLGATDLSPTHPVRLGLALNFSVFYYEILGKPDAACNIAKEAFDSAIVGLDAVNEENYRDSTLIMQLLRDNLTLWTGTSDEHQGGAGQELQGEDK